jgi:3-polyprenyl-4-hydroxybenzoate decarboxylase and related decarboxylases
LNAGAYRAQVHDKKTVGIVMAAGHHGRIHRDKSFKRGEPLPVVMVLGGDPIAFFFGGLEAPYGVFELDLVGGLRGRPVEMVRGKVTGLPSRQCRDRARRLRPARSPPCEGRSASGPDITPAACANPGARHQGDLPPQRSDRAGRAAHGREDRTKWRATAP